MDDLKRKIYRQINVVKGQLEGIRKMIEEEKDCLSVATQVKAVKSGVNKIGRDLIARRFTESMNMNKRNMSEKELQNLLDALSKT